MLQPKNRVAIHAAAAITLLFSAGATFAQNEPQIPKKMMKSSAAEKPADAPPPPTMDTNNDGKADAWDRDANGMPDAWDINNDGKPDLLDNDGDGKPDGDGKTMAPKEKEGGQSER